MKLLIWKKQVKLEVVFYDGNNQVRHEAEKVVEKTVTSFYLFV